MAFFGFWAIILPTFGGLGSSYVAQYLGEHMIIRYSDP